MKQEKALHLRHTRKPFIILPTGLLIRTNKPCNEMEKVELQLQECRIAKKNKSRLTPIDTSGLGHQG